MSQISVGMMVGRKPKGYKQHIMVDTVGNLIQVIVHAANLYDTKAGCDVKKRSHKIPNLEVFAGDSGYA